MCFCVLNAVMLTDSIMEVFEIQHNLNTIKSRGFMI